MDLQDPALEHPVLGPRPREVLDAGHLHERHIPRLWKTADPVAVGVAGEVADQCRPPADDLNQPLGVVGPDAEVGVGPLP